MRKKLLKNFPIFTGRKIKMFLLSVSTINAIIFLIVLSTICTCKKDSTLNWKDFIGKWELEQLLIDGHDTTSFIKADTNCYGYTIFGISKDNAKYILQEPVRTVGTNFHCYMSGFWGYYQSISINYDSNNNNVGPYLSGELPARRNLCASAMCAGGFRRTQYFSFHRVYIYPWEKTFIRFFQIAS